MNSPDTANPILPAPGVSRNSASNTEASRSSNQQNDDVSVNRDSRGDRSRTTDISRPFCVVKIIIHWDIQRKHLKR